MIWNQSRECMSRDEMNELQGRQLVKLVKHMYHNAEYYRMKMKLLGIEPGDIQGMEDLDKLPFTTKQDLKRADWGELFAVPQNEIIRYQTTCIAAGSEVMIGYTKNDLRIWKECAQRAIHTAGQQNTKELQSLIQDDMLWAEKSALQKSAVKENIICDLCRFAGSWFAGACKYQKGMHVQEDYFLAEVLDANTSTAVPDRCKGELVVTTLSKEAVPLIRYKTTNITSIHHERCECGRTTARIEKFCERADEVLLIRGNTVFPSYIESVLMDLEDIQAHYMVSVKKEANLDIVEVFTEPDEPGCFSYTDDEILKSKIARAVQSAVGMKPRVILAENHSIGNFEGPKVTIADDRSL